MRRQQIDFKREYTHNIALGVGLCVLSPVPASICAVLEMTDGQIAIGAAALLVMVAAGVFLFTRDGIIHEGFSQVLQEGSNSLARKRRRYAFAHLGDRIAGAVDNAMKKM